jgi:hypothetical protein
MSNLQPIEEKEQEIVEEFALLTVGMINTNTLLT